MTPKSRSVLIMCTRCSGTGIALQQKREEGLALQKGVDYFVTVIMTGVFDPSMFGG